MLRVALTGNIASGKSYVLDFLKTKGFHTLCLDVVTNDIYLNNSDFKSILQKKFLTHDKKEISKIVFNSSSKLKELEDIILPFITEKLDDFFIENKNSDIVIVAAPMLFEYNFFKYFDKVAIVVSDTNIRKVRLMKRNNLSENEAIKRINAQQNQEDKIKKSDYVILNNGTIDELNKNAEKFTVWLNTLL